MQDAIIVNGSPYFLIKFPTLPQIHNNQVTLYSCDIRVDTLHPKNFAGVLQLFIDLNVFTRMHIDNIDSVRWCATGGSISTKMPVRISIQTQVKQRKYGGKTRNDKRHSKLYRSQCNNNINNRTLLTVGCYMQMIRYGHLSDLC